MHSRSMSRFTKGAWQIYEFCVEMLMSQEKMQPIIEEVFTQADKENRKEIYKEDLVKVFKKHGIEIGTF